MNEKKGLTMQQLIQATIEYFLTRPMGEVEALVLAWRQVKVTEPTEEPKKEKQRARSKEK